MMWIPAAPSHSCCPHPSKPDPDRCEKAGCLSSILVLPPESVAGMIELPGAAAVGAAVAENSKTEYKEFAVFHPAEYELLLRLHQLLI